MINKVSDITAQKIAEYIRVDITGDTQLENELNTYLNVAKHYIADNIGLPITAEGNGKSIDSYPDLVIVALILCQDMYDNKAYYLDGKSPQVNKTVESILNMHVRNLL